MAEGYRQRKTQGPSLCPPYFTPNRFLDAFWRMFLQCSLWPCRSTLHQGKVRVLLASYVQQLSQCNTLHCYKRLPCFSFSENQEWESPLKTQKHFPRHPQSFFYIPPYHKFFLHHLWRKSLPIPGVKPFTLPHAGKVWVLERDCAITTTSEKLDFL
jgi:hypothetical protein